MRRRLIPVLCLLASCSYFDPTGIPESSPAIYREWYREVESCSGLRGDFDKIHWQHSYNIKDGRVLYAGYWYPKHTITIRDDYALDERVVKHEAMHDLTQSGSHPALYFKELCGDLMSL